MYLAVDFQLLYPLADVFRQSEVNVSFIKFRKDTRQYLCSMYCVVPLFHSAQTQVHVKMTRCYLPLPVGAVDRSVLCSGMREEEAIMQSRYSMSMGTRRGYNVIQETPSNVLLRVHHCEADVNLVFFAHPYLCGQWAGPQIYHTLHMILFLHIPYMNDVYRDFKAMSCGSSFHVSW